MSPISIRNTREIHENNKNKHFKVTLFNQLAVFTLFGQNFKNFNQLVNPLTIYQKNYNY